MDFPDKFTCFNVIFSPSGRLVSLVDDSVIQFDSSDPVFSGDPNLTKLWDYNVANNNANGTNDVRYGVSAVTLFEYGQYLARQTGGGSTDPVYRTGYINVNGQFLPINYYTGQMFPRR